MSFNLNFGQKNLNSAYQLPQTVRDYDSLYNYGNKNQLASVNQNSLNYNGTLGLQNQSGGFMDNILNKDNFTRESMFGGASGGGWLTGGAQALGSLGQLWAGINQTNLAKKQFNFTRGLANRNLANQALDYNTQLEDRTNSRNAFNAGSRPDRIRDQAYIDDRKVNGAAI